MRTVTAQSEVQYARLSYFTAIKHNYQAIIVLLTSWLMFASIMTKCFSSLMLNTYFKQTTVLLIRSLQELIDKEEYFVAVTPRNLEYFLDNDVLNQEEFDSLSHRRDKYQEHIGFELAFPMRVMSPLVFKEMTNGLAITLLNSFELKIFDTLYVTQSERYGISDHKYIHKLIVHYIGKNSLIFEEMKFA